MSTASKPTIIVVGLLGKQAARVRRNFGRRAELVFVSKDARRPRIPAGDHVVLMLDFVNHYWSEAALRDWPRGRVHRFRGNVSGLGRLLEGLLG